MNVHESMGQLYNKSLPNITTCPLAFGKYSFTQAYSAVDWAIHRQHTVHILQQSDISLHNVSTPVPLDLTEVQP